VAFKFHALGVVHSLAGLYAHEDVLVFPVVLFDIVGVVGDCQRYAGFLMYADKPGGGLLFLLQPVILYFQIEVLRSEQGGQLLRLGLGPLVIAVSNHPGDGASDAAGEAYKPLVPFPQKRPVDAGLDVKALREGHGHHIAQIAVAGLVFAQQDEVGVFAVDAVLLVGERAGGHIDLAADDGLHARLAAGAVKRHRAVHDAVVRDGQRVLTQLFGAPGQLADAARAVQQAVFGMDMEMDKGHGDAPFAGFRRGRRARYPATSVFSAGG